MPNQTSYLHRLRFPERLRTTFIGKYLANPRLVILFILSILALGITSYFSLPRRLNPEVNIPLVIVSTVLPGANPQDVESLITIPIEDELSGLRDLKTISSTSRESFSLTQLEFNSGIDAEKARADVQAAIDQAELPEDATTPNVQSVDFENQPVWTFTLIGQGDVASLTNFARILKDDLEAQGSIGSVTTGGLEEQEISVVIDPASLTTYSISPFQLSSLVKSSLSSFSSLTQPLESLHPASPTTPLGGKPMKPSWALPPIPSPTVRLAICEPWPMANTSTQVGATTNMASS